MKALGITLGAIALVLFVGYSWVAGSYNSLVAGDQQVDATWATVQTQYQRRFDLIGNLVASVKGAQGQELAVLTAIADARKQYTTATTADGKVQAVNAIESNLALIPRLQEAYPDLKSNDTLNGLMAELAGTENRVQVARDRYNEQVRVWNTTVAGFPRNVLAGMFGFHSRTYYQSDAGAENAPTVDFSK